MKKTKNLDIIILGVSSGTVALMVYLNFFYLCPYELWIWHFIKLRPQLLVEIFVSNSNV